MGPDFLYGEAEAPCQITCPAHRNIPAYVALIGKGKFKEALELIRQRMPLPSVCGRVCPAPCMASCNRIQLDGAVNVRQLERFAAEMDMIMKRRDQRRS